MSEPNQTRGGIDPAVLPGHIISPGDYGQYCDFQDYLIARHKLQAELAAQLAADTKVGEKIVARAETLIGSGWFRQHGPAFTTAVNDPDLLPWRLWTNLRVTEPAITVSQCVKLLQGRASAVRRALDDAWGYTKRSGDGKKPTAPETAGAKLTGTGSAGS